jgi:NAD(P)H-dependent flavin oxidoreductase YrpB (nitropropane dioxygenase family)
VKNPPITDLVGIDVPIFAFSPFKEVVAEVSRAGGIGIFATIRTEADEIDRDLTWLDRELNGLPYGVDVVLPNKSEGSDEHAMSQRIPLEYKEFQTQVCEELHIPPPENKPEFTRYGDRHIITTTRTIDKMEVVFGHKPRILASALGPLPRELADRAHQDGTLVVGMAGHPKHGRHHLANGADIVVAQGWEAGGHTGEISTIVLVPQMVDAIAPVPVLAAGGIADGRQVAAAMALGAAGVWTGSVWLTVAESKMQEVIKRKLLAAETSDAIRSKCLSGKPIRQLRTKFVDAWEADGAPDALPSPLQGMLVRDSQVSIWENNIEELMATAVGQVVGSISDSRPAGELLADMTGDARIAAERLMSIVGAQSWNI